MDAMLEAICEAKLQWFLGVVERLCAEEEAFAIALLERLGIPLSVRRLGTPWPTYHAGCAVAFLSADEEIEGVLYAISVSLEAAGRL
ncbi:MAG: hypothetical protein WBF49_10475 [Methyloceanibacter sp.]